MKSSKLLSIAAALVLCCCTAVGCADSSSDSTSKNESSSSQSSKADSSEKDSSAADSSNNQDASKPDSSQAVKPNEIGYNVETSKRLYDGLKEKYGKNGYKLAMKSTANMSSEIYLNVKDGKVSNTNKNPYSNKTMVYTGGEISYVFDHTSKTYTEEKVTDGKKKSLNSDLLFGFTGDFIKATIDEKNNVINEYYKIKADVTGNEGIICFCFSGSNGNFVQITVQYDGQEFPILFGVEQITDCDESSISNALEIYKDYKKQ
ncbi:MAG: hypothetical protein ILA17_06725 [Ruminococcus sp.]|nr:hypothetical protein [Ruminococcus sp.]